MRTRNRTHDIRKYQIQDKEYTDDYQNLYELTIKFSEILHWAVYTEENKNNLQVLNHEILIP